MKSDNALVRAICQRDEMTAAHEGVKDMLKGLKPGDLSAAQTHLRTTALDMLRRAVQIVTSKGTAADVAAYRAFITDVGKRVADAAKEGSFLGFGGQRVSEGERVMLASIETALGPAPA
jgi:hypothetical protein